MKDRLKKVIDYYNITPNNFSQKIGVSEGAIRKVLSQNTTLRSDTLDKISQNFADISIDWLVSGRGEMLRKPDNTNTTNENTLTATTNDNLQSLIDMLNRTLIEKDKQIDRLLTIIEKFK